MHMQELCVEISYELRMIKSHFANLFELGFRPFFLLATGFAALAIILWIAMWSGEWQVTGPFSPVDWHIHEMLFGYSSAVICGFLLTAVPNWTGLDPIKGWPLALAALLWLAGRGAVFGLTGLSNIWVMWIEGSFLASLAVVTAIQLIVSRNWRNLVVVGLVGLLLGADIWFHLEFNATGSTDASRRAGFAVIVLMIMMIGGRIIPVFTRNWLVAQQVASLPTGFGRFDSLSLLVAVIAMGLWITMADHVITALALVAASVMHLIRMSRWQGLRVLRSAILLMLHISYLCLVIGIELLSLPIVNPDFTHVAGLHVLGMGGIGGMTIAVMLRASMGHTGRKLAAGPMLSVAFGLIIVAAFIRALLPDISPASAPGIVIAALMWVAGFVLIAIRVWPWLTRPRVGPS